MTPHNQLFNLVAIIGFLILIAVSSTCLATENNSTLEAIAQQDSALRAALSSNQKAEERIREQFGKELSALRKARLQALEQAFARASSKRNTEAVASLATLINNLKDEETSEPTSPQDEAPLVGTALRFGSFVMFLAPHGVAWFVNMDADRDVHRFSWRPAGANKVKWKSTHPDPKQQNNTITIDGEKCVLRADDVGTEGSGKVFRP